MARRPKPVHQMTIPQFEAMFPHEEACKAYLKARRWPDAIYCPRCGVEVTHAVKTMPFKWQCYSCAPGSGYRFSVIAGTIFENTNKTLREWFRVVHLMLTSKKGMSALQIQRVMGFGSYETAWSMCHKIRAALIEPEVKLGGIVEVDETFIGGKDKNRHWDKKSGYGGGQLSKKFVVIGAVKRKGNVIARVIEHTDTATFDRFVRETVSTKVSLLATDEHSGYRHLGDDYNHQYISHGTGQYVVGSIHTNTIEGFWSILKRSVVGTFHMVSKKYLPLYVAECEFKYNNRMNEGIFETAISGC